MFGSIGYLEQVVGFLIATFALNGYLDYRQLRRTYQPQPAATKRLEPDPAVYEKAQQYSRTKLHFSLSTDWLHVVKEVLLLTFFVYPAVWRQCGDWFGEDSFLQAAGFLLIFRIVDTIFSIPFSLYQTFVIEERFGMNKTTLRLFCTDTLKTFAIGFVLIPLLLYPLLWILRIGGDFLWLYLWIFAVVLMVFLITIKPILIDPLFNEYAPLPPGELRSRIEALASKLGFPLSQLFTVDGSKRSSHSNAYFFGIWSKRIVLFDTLFTNSTIDQVEAIIGHELGHWFHSHVLWNVLIIQSYLGTLLYLAGFFMHSPELFQSFGFDTTPPIIGLTLFFQILSPLDTVISFFMNYLSRRFEYQADQFAVKLGLGEHLISGLTTLFRENLGNLNPDPLYSTFHHSHPSISERIAAIETTLAKRS